MVLTSPTHIQYCDGGAINFLAIKGSLYASSATIPDPLSSQANCRSCGREFLRRDGEEMTAQYYRCEDCNNSQKQNILLFYATCGLSQLCQIS
ncbi:unnamed protein product [Chrysoparadoxa australica]